jgi:K+ transporter
MLCALAPERLFCGAEAVCGLLQVFQIVSQAIVQNFFPRFHIYHTSREHRGQVRAQFCNRVCSACVLALLA